MAEGVEWLTKAAEQGEHWAQSNLGHILTNPGQPGTSRVAGYRWLLLASQTGDEPAKKQLETLRPLLTVDELKEAERLAAEFEPKLTASTQRITRRCRTDDPRP